MYTQDNGDALPWCQWYNSYGPSWIYMPKNGAAPDPYTLVGNSLVDNTNDMPYILQSVYYQYVRNRQVYYCPLDRKENIDFIYTAIGPGALVGDPQLLLLPKVGAGPSGG